MDEPHIRIYLDVTDASGAVTKWECEGSAPGGLLSNGWSKESLTLDAETFAASSSRGSYFS